MQEYQQRVIDEKKELDEKIDKLIKFIESGTFDQISEEDKYLLSIQSEIMEKYSDILDKRIAKF